VIHQKSSRRSEGKQVNKNSWCELLSKALEDKVNKKREEMGPVAFMRAIGKKEYDILTLFAEAGNKSDEMKAELADWDRVLQFKAQGAEPCYLKIAGGKVSANKGQHEKPDLTFETNTSDDMMGMLSGAVDGTQLFMSGGLRIDGPLPDAIKFGNMGQLMQKYLTNEKTLEIWKLKVEDVAKKLEVK
jgi:putative sterol carrier protein